MGKQTQRISADSWELRHVSSCKRRKISDLWRLDALGILGQERKELKQNLREAAGTFQGVKMDSDGKYVVSLPWIQGHPPLPRAEI
ncbi:hypothetical protein TNIN_345661 [Trichonephila inaurata madagascariensis]|uniref:Uncharacterized protein n=1 Tax=Trichonephila inaurata madagascariensis TaxID=2747483 RepID=A0A8X6I8H4_9ARAC|nr:hypothetical protein TNIN_345661 [Trichonephila inaurata madagascariensis]